LIGFRWTIDGGAAGVDGVENAAETFALLVKAAGAEDAFDGDGGSGFGALGAASGIALRDGGVSGAPNDIDIGGAASAP
jgi:hypothetical protein